MKIYNLTFLFIMLMSIVGVRAFAHDIAVANADGKTIYYDWINGKTELSVSHMGNWVIPPDIENNYYSGEIAIPESLVYDGRTYKVTRIGVCAFYGCMGLTSVTIPNSVTCIGEYAFNCCTGLTSATIPNSVTSIGGSAFYGTPWFNNYPDGIVYAGKVAYKYKGKMPDNTEIVLRDGTLGIADYAFYGCTSLTSVTIPNSVTNIGRGAFYGCTGLTSFTIPNSVTNIGSGAFEGCTGLTSFSIPNSVTTICSHAFYGCTGLTYMTIPNSVTSIDEGAFQRCTGLTSVSIPNSVTTIGNYAFHGCTGLTSVTIPNSVISIGIEAFSGLNSVTIGTGLLSIGQNAFDSPKKVIWMTNTPPSGYTNVNGVVNYVANDQYTSLSNKTVYPFLSSIFEKEGVRYVPVSPSDRTCDVIDCLYNKAAESISIGKTVTRQGISLTVKEVKPYAFYGNDFIKEVKLEYDGAIGDYAFHGCKEIENAKLGPGIISIGESSFGGCSQLKSIAIPDAVSVIGRSAFASCSSMTSTMIGANVKTIGEYAFNNCSSLPTITIPPSVTEIKNHVFTGCKKLNTVIIEDKDSELMLGYDDYYSNSAPLFADCQLDYVYIGRNISYSTSSSAGYSPFYRNTSLRTVVITDKETEISENEFYGCTNLQSFTVGDGVKMFGDWAFSGCSSLKSLSFGSGLQSIGKEAFSDCVSVTKIVSKAATPPSCSSQALDDINKWDCTLHVPSGSLSAYQAADQWKEFFFISDSMPTDIEDIVEDRSDVFALQAVSGYVRVFGLDDGTRVAVYDLKGVLISSGTIRGGEAVIPVNRPDGSLIVVQADNRSVKAMLK